MSKLRGLAALLTYLGAAAALSVTTALASPDVSRQGAHCPPLNRTTLAKRLANGKPIRLVFFATWCSDCASHLQDAAEATSGEVLAIAVFDTQAKVEKTLGRLGLSVPCAMDDGLARTLGVKVVPAERVITSADINVKGSP